MKNTFEELIEEHGIWADATFAKGTAYGALTHAKREILEIQKDLGSDETIDQIAIEYADAIFCIMDSARRYGVSVSDIVEAGYKKMAINKLRTWKDNGDGSYSHIK